MDTSHFDDMDIHSCMEENEVTGQRMSHPLWYTRRMMTLVKDVKWDTDDILEIEGVLWKIVKVFNFDHEGHECDVVTLMNFNGDERELYTYDEGTTFVED